MKSTFTRWLAGCLVSGGLVWAAPALAQPIPTSAFAPTGLTDLYARKNGDSSAGEDHNYFFAPEPGRAHCPDTLLLFLPGHGASLDSYVDFMTEAAAQGYYVVGLAFRNGQSVPNLCGYWPDCPSHFMEQIVDKNSNQGFYAGFERGGTPAAENSINYRLGAFLSYLNSIGAGFGADWEQFYDYPTDDVNWQRIVVAGHSEGGDVATWITKNKPVIAGLAFESPYSDLDNANSTGSPFNEPDFTPCDTTAHCPYTGGVTNPKKHVDQFASFLKNDSSDWANKLWVTLDTHDLGYIATATSDPWPGLNMHGATAALGKSETLFSSVPATLGSHKWWTSTVASPQGCSGHDATVVDGCYPSWMPGYWDLVLRAANPLVCTPPL